MEEDEEIKHTLDTLKQEAVATRRRGKKRDGDTTDRMGAGGGGSSTNSSRSSLDGSESGSRRGSISDKESMSPDNNSGSSQSSRVSNTDKTTAVSYTTRQVTTQVVDMEVVDGAAASKRNSPAIITRSQRSQSAGRPIDTATSATFPATAALIGSGKTLGAGSGGNSGSWWLGFALGLTAVVLAGYWFKSYLIDVIDGETATNH